MFTTELTATNRLHQGQGLGWRYSSLPSCSVTTQNGKGWGGSFKLLCYSVEWVETNQPPQDLFISSMWYLV